MELSAASLAEMTLRLPPVAAAAPSMAALWAARTRGRSAPPGPSSTARSSGMSSPSSGKNGVLQAGQGYAFISQGQRADAGIPHGRGPSLSVCCVTAHVGDSRDWEG